MIDPVDRQMLELAAKAGGIRLEWDGPPDKWQPMYYKGKTYHSWDPRHDDGDSRRLQNHLRIGVEYEKLHTVAVWCQVIDDWITEYCEDGMGADIDDKTRLAVLRAAAEFGKAMP